MKLLALQPLLVRYYAEPVGMVPVNSLDEAQGVIFNCPKCWFMDGDPSKAHSILVWFADRNVPDMAVPRPRWHAEGTSLKDLTLRPSIDLGAGDWHGFITNGEIT